MPFSKRIATRDFHPPDHVSFASSHPPHIKAFQSTVMITNPWNTAQTQGIPVWPTHCVQGTPGSNIIPELDVSKVDHVVDKGRDSRVEMFSVFADGFGNKTSAASEDVATLLRSAGVRHVFVVGVAGDYCVKHTATDAKKEGFDVFVIEEAVRSIDHGPRGWSAAKEDFQQHDIKVISMEGPEITQLRTQSPSLERQGSQAS